MSPILNRLTIKGSVAVLAAGLLSACAPVDGGKKVEADVKQVRGNAAARAAAEKPKGAVLIKDGLYAVPLAVDKDGCEHFRTWSETGPIPLGQPIYYHDGNGSFSSTRLDDASCSAKMVETAPDPEGCPTFRAEQPDGSTSDVQYFQSASGYTTTKERSVCEG